MATSIVCLLLIVYSVVSVFGKTTEVPEKKLQVIEGAVYNILEQAHYSRIKLDDNYSEKVFDKLFENLDFEKKYFTRQDFSKWSKQEKQMDDDVRSTDLDFFYEVDSTYRQRLDLTEKWYREILSTPFDYSQKETLVKNTEDMDYEADFQALKERWRKLLKERALMKYDDLLSNRDKNTDSLRSAGEYKDDAELEAEARESIQKLFDRYYKRLRKMHLQDRFTLYINSYLAEVDPHTNYFPPQDKEDFDVAMSGSFSGIGAQLRQDEDQTKVERIIVGSPCYKQGELQKGDIILRVGQSEEEATDITGMDLDDVVRLIRGKKGTEVRLTVQHLDGSKQVIPIVRDKVDLEETYVKSAFIHVDDKKIAYISLPEFYFDTRNYNGRTCYKDMRKEIQNINNEGSDGLIVDLRNNGGGSLQDVIKIVGLFIKSGPVVTVKDRGGKEKVLQDQISEVLYEGPLTILVNESSASASEIMAAALQDYNRATIIGNTTFGKGTVQQFVDIDKVVPSQAIDQFLGNLDEDQKALGSVKLTIQKFYRINGGSTQRKGVTPDVLVPDVYEYIDRGERQMNSAMPWDKISSSRYKKVNVDHWNDAKVAKLNSYVQKSDYFRDVLDVADFLKKEKDQKLAYLDINTYRQQKDKKDQLFKNLEKYKEDTTRYANVLVSNPDFRKELVTKDEVAIDRNKKWLKAIREDHVIDLALKYYF